MLRKFLSKLICAGILASGAAMAMNHELSQGVSIEYEFLPDTPELLTNYTIFKINASCTIQTSPGDHIIHIRDINRKGSINGEELEKGDEINVVVHNNDQLTLTAQSGAQVEFTNRSSTPIKALCKTV